jgi:hypothetical protein
MSSEEEELPARHGCHATDGRYGEEHPPGRHREGDLRSRQTILGQERQLNVVLINTACMCTIW